MTCCQSNRHGPGGGGDGNEWLIGSRGHDIVFGDEGQDHILGRRGSDILCGGLGDDDLRGWRGHDSLAAGSGADTQYGAPGPDTIWTDTVDQLLQSGEILTDMEDQMCATLQKRLGMP